MHANFSRVISAGRACGAGLLIACFGLTATRASAAVLLWDSDSVGGVANDGTGTWENGVGTDWVSGGSNVLWNNANGDTAAFGDGVTTGGVTSTVTVAAGGVTVGGINFNAQANNGSLSLFRIQGGMVTLNDGAAIHNLATTDSALHSIDGALFTTGTVTLKGRRFWMSNTSFGGGGTLNIETTGQALFRNGGAFDGLSVINLNSGGIDIRGGSGGYNYAAGTTLNVNESLSLNSNSLNAGVMVNWLGPVVVKGTKTLSLTPVNAAATTLRMSEVISESGGVGNVTVNGSAASTTIFANANTYTGRTRVLAGNLQVGAAGVGATGSGLVTVESATAMLSGTGTVRGATTISSGASLRPGDGTGSGVTFLAGGGVGKLTFSDVTANSLILATGSTTFLTLAGATGNEANPLDGIQTVGLLTGGLGAHDQISVAGSLTLNTGSTIQVSLGTGYSPVFGDVFNLLDWATTSGALLPNAFNVNTDLVLETSAAMTLNGWSWDRSQFLSSGVVYVVPEPGRMLLLTVGLFGWLIRRDKKRV